MINRIMKFSGEKAFDKDLTRIDLSLIDPSVTEVTDVCYLGDGDIEHTLDIYYVEDGRDHPVLIDIHGGGFISYGKKFDRVFANVMAQRGFTVFEVDFRLAYPEYTVFDQISDIDMAVRWIICNAAEYSGNPERLYISGHSSGGVLATAEALLSLSPEMCSDYGFDAKDYNYCGILLDCGLMHYYKKSIAYNGMRRMVFPKGYESDRRYEYLLFDSNPDIARLPKVALVTNKKDVLTDMTHHFDGVLRQNRVEHKLFDQGSTGHTGMVFRPVTEGYDLPGQIISFLC